MKNESPESRKENWLLPPEERVKLNVDAAFQSTSGEASMGIIIRDNMGQALLSAWKIIRSCASEVAEAEACWKGIQLAAEWIMKPTIIESDCLNIVEGLQETGVNMSGIPNIVKEMKASMKLLLEARVRKVGRECNRASAPSVVSS
jgi:ribonuclease HI